MRFLLTLSLCAFALSSPLYAKIIGQGELHVLFWHAYNAQLSSPTGTYSPAKPHTLTLTYQMEFTKEELVERTMKELTRHVKPSAQQKTAWEKQLLTLWPSVKKGDFIRADAVPHKQVTFYFNGTKKGSIRDATFAKHFTQIWLGENTSDPGLREQLLGQHNATK